MWFWRSPFGAKRLKYNTGKKKIELDGHKFDSKLEATFYEFMKNSGVVKILEVHPRFELQGKYETKDGRKIRAIDYIADFRVDVCGDLYIIDAKGQETSDFKIKRKIFEKRYPDDVLVVCKTLKELRIAIM